MTTPPSAERSPRFFTQSGMRVVCFAVLFQCFFLLFVLVVGESKGNGGMALGRIVHD